MHGHKDTVCEVTLEEKYFHEQRFRLLIGSMVLIIQGYGLSHICACALWPDLSSCIPQPSSKCCGCSLWGGGLSMWLTDTNLSPFLKAHVSHITQPVSLIAFVTVCNFCSLCFFVYCLAVLEGRMLHVGRTRVHLVCS